MEQEIWKPINDYPGYEVSNYGKVYSHHSKRLLKPYYNNSNYPYVTLGRKGRELVHRLVGLHFVPNPNNYPIVLHEDHDPTNFFYKNLKWGTHKQNTQDSVVCGRITTDKCRKVKLEKITTYILLSPQGVLTPVKNLKKFQETMGFSNSLSNLVRHKIKSYKGWTTTFCPVVL